MKSILDQPSKKMPRQKFFIAAKIVFFFITVALLLSF